ncbi:MAG: type II secretory pathway component PulC [Desulforhopalus sp.]|jgi:type II secretory pathway component PulC
MQGRMSNIIPLFLITIFSIVAVEGLYQALEIFVFKPPGQSKTIRQQETNTPGPKKDSSDQKPDYRAILKRNLFGRSDEGSIPKPTAPSEEDTATSFTELGIVLMGTISGSDNNNRAIILTKKTRDQELFSAGEVIEGALIKDIQRGKLVLEINGKEETLDMSEAATMRPAYRAPSPSAANKSVRSASLGGNKASPNINNASPVPRRRVVRRTRSTQNTPRSTEN